MFGREQDTSLLAHAQSYSTVAEGVSAPTLSYQYARERLYVKACLAVTINRSAEIEVVYEARLYYRIFVSEFMQILDVRCSLNL